MSMHLTSQGRALLLLSKDEANSDIDDLFQYLIIGEFPEDKEKIMSWYNKEKVKSLYSIAETVYLYNQEILGEMAEISLMQECKVCAALDTCVSGDFETCRGEKLDGICSQILREYPNEFRVVQKILDDEGHFYEIDATEIDNISYVFGIEEETILDLDHIPLNMMNIISGGGFKIVFNNSQNLLVPSLLEDKCYVVNNKVLVIKRSDYEATKKLN